jgi:hypothetical protein
MNPATMMSWRGQRSVPKLRKELSWKKKNGLGRHTSFTTQGFNDRSEPIFYSTLDTATYREAAFL